MREAAQTISELRSATRTLHEQLEASLAVAAEDAGREEFLHYLQDMWGWLSCFEAGLWQACWPTAMEAPARDGKLAWIESDLRAAGMTSAALAALPRADYRPALDTAARRFGVAYVIEGAQLGVRVLERRLAPALSGWAPRWLQGYGDEQVPLWRGFMACAESTIVTEDARREAAAAAAEAFASLAQWFAHRQRMRAENEVRCASSAA